YETSVDWTLVNAPITVALSAENFTGENWALVSTPAGTVNVGGNVTLTAQDDASIYSQSQLAVSSVVTNNIDAFVQLAESIGRNEYSYTTKSPASLADPQTIEEGESVRLASDWANASTGIIG